MQDQMTLTEKLSQMICGIVPKLLLDRLGQYDTLQQGSTQYAWGPEECWRRMSYKYPAPHTACWAQRGHTGVTDKNWRKCGGQHTHIQLAPVSSS